MTLFGPEQTFKIINVVNKIEAKEEPKDSYSGTTFSSHTLGVIPATAIDIHVPSGVDELARISSHLRRYQLPDSRIKILQFPGWCGSLASAELKVGRVQLQLSTSRRLEPYALEE
jgi:hypothetical protein